MNRPQGSGNYGGGNGNPVRGRGRGNGSSGNGNNNAPGNGYGNGYGGGDRVRGRGRGNVYGGNSNNNAPFNGYGNVRQGQSQGSYNRGGGGDTRQGGGGRGHGRAPVGIVTYKNYQNEIRPTTIENQKLGWKIDELPLEGKKEDFLISKRIDGDPLILRPTKQKISLKTNHFPVKITLPPIFYQYEVELSRKIEEKTTKGFEAGDADADEEEVIKTNSKLPKDLRRRILQVAVEKMMDGFPGKKAGIITDFGVEIWSTKKLENNIPVEYEVNLEEIPNYDEDYEGTGIFIVKWRSTEGAIDTGPLQNVINDMRGHDQEQLIIEVKKVYNTLLKNFAFKDFMLTGRSNLIRQPRAFREPLSYDGVSLGQGLECWSGVSTLFEMGWKPYINFDMANSVFLVGKSVFGAIDELELFEQGPYNSGKVYVDPRKVRYWNNEAKTKTLELLKTCKVKYSPGPNCRTKTMTGHIIGIRSQSVSEQKFDYVEGGKTEEMSVYDFYLKKNHKKLKYKDGLCLQLRGTKKYVPAELCTIQAGQNYNRKLDADQTTRMLDIAKKCPHELEPYIKETMDRILGLREKELLTKFGVTHPKNMLKLDDVRVLDAPQLCYGRNSRGQRAIMEPTNGEFDIWCHDFEFYEPATISDYVVYHIGRPGLNGDIEDFVQVMKEFAKKRLLNFPDHSGIIVESGINDNEHHPNVQTFTEKFNKFKTQFQASGKDLKSCFVLVILPYKTTNLYDQVKQAAELNSGIITQCLVARNLKGQGSKVRSIVGNIFLKIHSKLGGKNQIPIIQDRFKAVDILRYPVLILGADVTHPPPGSGIKASFAAVTGLVDRSGMPYRIHIQAQMKAQKGACEVIQNLGDIVLKMIYAFRERSGSFPVKIIYFRDGVGEGQFKELLDVELRQIRDACNRVPSKDKPYQPKITFITVQKRHKTRFFMEENGRIFNCPPGTVIDSEIVHPTETDFYLLSHKGILGTSRPSRYHVLWDDSDFKIEEIQVLSYTLCYMFARCNRAVKIPAPTYYAHWAAQRAKVLTEQQINSVDDGNFNPQQHINDLNTILCGDNLLRIIRDSPMFFV